jgi:hypothetical protein
MYHYYYPGTVNVMVNWIDEWRERGHSNTRHQMRIEWQLAFGLVCEGEAWQLKRGTPHGICRVDKNGRPVLAFKDVELVWMPAVIR